MPPPRALCVIRVYRPTPDGPQGVVHVTALVERVGVDRDLYVVIVREIQARVYGRGGGAPILVELEPGRAGAERVDERARVARVALPGEAEIQGHVVRGAEHHLHRGGGGRARGRRRAGARARAAPEHGRHARGDGVVALLGADEVDVRVDAAGRHDHLLPRDDVRGRSHDHLHPGSESHAVHGVRIPRLPDVVYPVPLDADVGLDDAKPRVDDHRVRDDGIEGEGCRNGRHLTHALAQALAPPEFAFVSVVRVIILDAREEGRIPEPYAIPDGGAVRVGVRRPAYDVGLPLRYLDPRSDDVAESALPGVHPPLDLVPPRQIRFPPREAIAAHDVVVPPEGNEGHGLGFARFESDRRPGRHVETPAQRELPVEHEGGISLEECCSAMRVWW